LRVIRPAAATAGFFFSAEYCSRTGCHLIDEFIPANVSLRGLKNLSFSKIREPICPKEVRGRKKFSASPIIYFKFLENGAQCDTPFLIFVRPMAIPILQLRASAGRFIYTQLHSSDIANADSDPQ
jgi:hypothetical protein